MKDIEVDYVMRCDCPLGVPSMSPLSQIEPDTHCSLPTGTTGTIGYWVGATSIAYHFV